MPGNCGVCPLRFKFAHSGSNTSKPLFANVRGFQLAGQNFLAREGEYNTLKVTSDGWRVLRGEVTPRLVQPKSRK